MTEPLLSIITITYNAAPTVQRTLESLARQTFADYEHIVVDGASTDATLRIVSDNPCAGQRTVVSEPDRGLYDAMNKGLGLARGKYLLFLNAGDKFHSDDSLQQIASTIAANDTPGIVYGQTDLVDNDGRYIAPRHLTAPEQLTYADFAYGMLVCHQAFIPLRRIAPQFDTRYRFSADYDWCVQCLQHSRHNAYTGTILIDYLCEGLTSRNRYRSLRERFRIMAYYYGFWPTLCRHLTFISRFLRHRKQLKTKN